MHWLFNSPCNRYVKGDAIRDKKQNIKKNVRNQRPERLGMSPNAVTLRAAAIRPVCIES